MNLLGKICKKRRNWLPLLYIFNAVYSYSIFFVAFISLIFFNLKTYAWKWDWSFMFKFNISITSVLTSLLFKKFTSKVFQPDGRCTGSINTMNVLLNKFEGNVFR